MVDAVQLGKFPSTGSVTPLARYKVELLLGQRAPELISGTREGVGVKVKGALVGSLRVKRVVRSRVRR